MNKLYTGLIAVVLGTVGCGRSVRVSGQEPSQLEYCTSEKEQITNLEQQLKQQLEAAQQELAKANAAAQVSCDARVKEVEAKYASAAKPAAELPQTVTPQFPKMDKPMHSLIKAMHEGKYQSVENPYDVREFVSETPLLYRNMPIEGRYNVSIVKACPKSSKTVDLPAEFTECTAGVAVTYSGTDNSFQVDRWVEKYVATSTREGQNQGGDYDLVRESISFVGKGQLLTWNQVTEVEVANGNNTYEPTTVAVQFVPSEIAAGYTRTLAAIVKETEDSANNALKNGLRYEHTFDRTSDAKK